MSATPTPEDFRGLVAHCCSLRASRRSLPRRSRKFCSLVAHWRTFRKLFPQVSDYKGGEPACTPDSVPRSLAGPGPAAIPLGRRLPDGSSGLPGGLCRAGQPSPFLALLRVGFTEPPGSPRALVRSYRTVSPLPVRHPRGCVAIGGLLSVALSCGSPRLGVTQHPALWSPDVPRTDPRSRRNGPGTRPPGRLTTTDHATGTGPGRRLPDLA